MVQTILCIVKKLRSTTEKVDAVTNVRTPLDTPRVPVKRMENLMMVFLHCSVE